MNVFDYAIRMEQDGEKWYRSIADRSTSAGLKKIFSLLAVEEIRHCKAVEQLKRRLGNMYLEPTGILGEVKSVFRDMRKMDGEEAFDGIEGLDGFTGMRDYEVNCRNFYLEKAGQLDDMSQRIFLQLADEEDKHLRIMNHIIDFVSQEEPGKWLDRSEWPDPDDGGTPRSGK
ncbi:MAG TPA: rubrerythrin [Desulfobacteraceae bacterium]|nr:rubrerythrin [Desulfobacteraceae bacterium]